MSAFKKGMIGMEIDGDQRGLHRSGGRGWSSGRGPDIPGFQSPGSRESGGGTGNQSRAALRALFLFLFLKIYVFFLCGGIYSYLVIISSGEMSQI